MKACDGSPPSPQVLAAVRGNDPHDQLAIAYHLVWDNRMLHKVLTTFLKYVISLLSMGGCVLAR